MALLYSGSDIVLLVAHTRIIDPCLIREINGLIQHSIN